MFFIIPMTMELCQAYYRNFALDEDLLEDKSKYVPFQYSDEFSDGRVRRYAELGRIFMAVMLGQIPIGDIDPRNIDHDLKICELGIRMVNDSSKNQGYGTAAEELILKYTFYEMGMKTVLADKMIGNLRSRHVLEKVGFTRNPLG